MRIGVGHHAFDFGNCDHRQKFYEQQIHREENAERADECADVHPRRKINSPTRRKKILKERADDDDESFPPHAEVDAEADEENEFEILARAFEPKKLRETDVDEQHDPAAIPIRVAEKAMAKNPAFVG